MNKTLKIILWIVVIGLIAWAIYYFYNKQQKVSVLTGGLTKIGPGDIDINDFIN